MDEESHSTSQGSSNSREAVQMNTGVPLHNVNRRGVHCILCDTIYSPGNEANRHLNVCQDCQARVELYNEETRQVNLEEFQLRVEEALQGLWDSRWDLDETRWDLEENWWDLEETWWDLEETQRSLDEAQRGLEEIRQRLDVQRHHLMRRLKDLPRVIITEEHEKKHNGLVCAICLDPLSVGSIVNQLPCLHFFHPLCIMPWLKVRMSCPNCRYEISSAFHNETSQNSTTSNINEPEVVVSESHNGTTDISVRDREGSKGGWFLFVAAPIVSLVGIALVESLQNLLGGGRGRARGSAGRVEFPRVTPTVSAASSNLLFW